LLLEPNQLISSHIILLLMPFKRSKEDQIYPGLI
jgi:hypothetical protein